MSRSLSSASGGRTAVSDGPRWRAAGLSDVGRQREHNEDRFHCDVEAGLFVVIDGVGGHNAGEVASAIALDVLLDRLRRKTGTPEERLREAIALANNEIYLQASDDPERRGMACVLTAGVLEEGVLHLGHVGDTRCYKVRGGQITKLTRDHSPVGEREDAGELDEAEAMGHPRRNEIFRDVGTEPRDPGDEHFIDYVQVRCEPDSALVFCSDGLTDLVTAGQIMRIVYRTGGDPAAAARAAVVLANERGGKDNVTVVVAAGPDFGEAPVDAGAPTPAAPMPRRPPVKPSELGFVVTPEAAPPRRPFFRDRLGFFLYGLTLGVLGMLAGQLFWPAPPGGDEVEGAVVLRVGVPGDSTAFPSIQQAIDAALPGDVVEVAPGVYAEALRIRPGISVVGQGGRGVVVEPRGAVATAGVVIGEGSRLENVVVRSAPEEPLVFGVVVQGTGVEVDDVEVTGIGGVGLVIDSLAQATVRSSFIRGNAGTGVLIHHGANARLVQNLIIGNGLLPGQPQPGLAIAETAEVALTGNVVRGNAGGELSVTPPERAAAYRERNFIGPFPEQGG